METNNVTEILNELNEIAKTSKDEQVRLQAYSMILSECKSLKYQDFINDALGEMVNSFRKL